MPLVAMHYHRIRNFFSDWSNDELLVVAHQEASGRYKGGVTSPFGRPPFVPD
jgi:hypothetical protein